MHLFAITIQDLHQICNAQDEWDGAFTVDGRKMSNLLYADDPILVSALK